MQQFPSHPKKLTGSLREQTSMSRNETTTTTRLSDPFSNDNIDDDLERAR
jgi:hypothetical protein